MRLTVTDPARRIGASLLLDTIQELRDAGAEAIVINGVLVSGTLVEPPYVIEAIGDPATMESAMGFRGGVADRVASRSGTLTVEQVATITITALAEPLAPEYARNDP